MTKTKSTKRALWLSVLSLLACVSMLVGSTFAWFTDSVTSGMNTIAAGNLDVELLSDDGIVNATTKLFDDVTLWEPGVVVYENLQVSNEGTLALKYQMNLNFGNENDLNGHKLSEVLKIAVVDAIAAGASRADVLAAAKASANVGTLSDFVITGALEAGAKSAEQAIVIFWEPNANEIDNLYNANNGQTTSDGLPLHIEFGVHLQAIQLDFESDSFGKDYDEGLNPTTAYVSTVSDMQAAIEANQNITLMADLEIDADTPMMFTDSSGGHFYLYHKDITIDLNGHDIVVDADALKEGKTYANGLFIVRYSTLNIVGDGNVITNNKAIPVYGWAHSEINIYGGTYISNAYERNESAVYVNNSSVTINVYGGDYLSSHYAFNAHDTSANAPVIVLHEGIVYEKFLKNGTVDVTNSDVKNGRIVLAEGCTLETFEENGTTYHRVVKGTGVSNADDLVAALNEGGNVVLQSDVTLPTAATINKAVSLNLNGHTLSTTGLELKNGGVIENGIIKSAGNTNMVPHLAITGGTAELNNVTVEITDYLNGNSDWTEATGLAINNAVAVLNNCNVSVHNDTVARWVFSYGISFENATATINGGTISSTCVNGTAANGPTNPNGISTIGACEITLNDVDVIATYYATTVNGHLTLNTTDDTVTSADIVDNRGGSHTINYID